MPLCQKTVPEICQPLSPLPGDLRRDYGPCDYDIRNNLNAQYVYELPSKFRNHSLAYAFE